MKISTLLTNCKKPVIACLMMLFCLMMKSEVGWGQTVVLNPASPWIVPAGVSSIKVEVWGGGGGGGGCNSGLGTTFGSGGGGGAFNSATFSVSTGQNYTIVRGTGGTAASDANGGNGTASSVSGPGGTIAASFGLGGGRRGGTAGAGGTGGVRNGGNGGTATSNGAGGGGGAGNAGNGNNGSNTAFGTGGIGSPNSVPYIGGNGGGAQTGNGNGNTGGSPGGGGGGGKQTFFDGAKSGGAGAAGQVVITYYFAPTISGFSPASGCAGSNLSVVITGTNFTGATAVQFGATTAAYTVNSATQITATMPTGLVAGNYAISVTTAGGTATSATNFTVNPRPAAPLGTGDSRCGTGTVNISATPGGGETIDWYANPTGGPALVTGTTTYTTPSISTTTTYFAESRNTTTGCISASRTAVIATVNNTAMPAGISPQIFCDAASPTVADLTATGTTIQWYANGSGGSALSSSTPLVDGIHYYASQTDAGTGCEGTARLDVTAIVSTALTGLSYSADPASYCANAVITPNVPTTTGGTAVSYSVSPSLPNGLNLNTSTGEITGTPITPAAAANFTITATNGCNSVQVTISIAILTGAPTGLTYSSNPVTYCENVLIADNTPSNTGGAVLSYSISPALPVGLNFDLSTGIISGTPTAATPAANYTVTATNGCGSTTQQVNITVASQVTSVSYSVSTATYCTGIAIAPNAVSSVTGGGTITYSGSLPAGLSINSSTGAISGTPTTATAAATYTITASNGCSSAQTTVDITVITSVSSLSYSSNSPTYCTNVAIASNTPSITGGGTITYSVSPALPVGLSFDPNTGIISGTPTTVTASAPYTVTATNGCSSTTKVLTIAVIANVTSVSYTSPTVTYCTGYAITPNTVSSVTGGGTITYSAGSLPAGLSISSTTGTISGTPSATSPATNYTITANNGCSSAQTTVNITVIAGISALSYSPSTATVCVGTAITNLNPSVTGGGTISYSITPALPAGLSINPSTGVISGSPTAPSSTTTYTVTATNGCSSKTASVILTVNYNLNGIYTVGGGGNFTTLTAAVNAYNSACLGGNVTFNILNNLSAGETFPISIYNPAASSTKTLTIKPNTTNVTISGSSSSSIIQLNGADYVIIDGSSNGTSSQDLAIKNNSTTKDPLLSVIPLSDVIWIASRSSSDGATNNTIKNCKIVGSDKTSTWAGIASGDNSIPILTAVGTSQADFPNSNNTVDHCAFSNAIHGVYIYGATSKDQNWDIKNNNFTSGYGSGVNIQYIQNSRITGNTISGIDADAGINGNTTGIEVVGNATTVTISDNDISNITNTGALLSGNTDGIRIGASTQAFSITNNTISNISSSSNAAPAMGIEINGVMLGGNTIAYNKITNISQTNALIIIIPINGYGAEGIYLNTSGSPIISIYNNFIANVYAYGTNATPTYNNNGYGIAIDAGSGYKIYYNSINLKTQQTSTGSYSAAVFVSSGVTATGAVDLQNNILSNTQTAGVPAGKRYCIYSTAGKTVFNNTIDYNDYYTTGQNLGFIGPTGNRTNIAGMVTGFGGNTNSVSALPNFISATDLHLKNYNNFCLATGVQIPGITDDIDGDARVIPMMGADEVDPYNFSSTAVPSVCVNSAAVVTVTIPTSTLPTGTYTVTYDLTGANTGTSLTATLTYTTGNTATFIIPAALLQNAGSTTVVITNIGQTAACGNPSPTVTGTIPVGTGLTNQATFTVNDLPTIAPDPSAAPVCFSTSAQTTTLAYSTTTFTPTTYSITWSSSPTNTFVAVTNAGLPAGAIIINVPANTAPGTYTGTLTVQNANGCPSSSGINFTLTVNAIPLQYTVSGGGSYCAGSGVNITLSNSQAGIIYELILNGTPTGITATGTGGPITFSNISTDGTYTISASINSTGCTNTMFGSVNVSMITSYTWSGFLNTDWNTTQNWCNLTVPNSSGVDVTIPNVTNKPQLPVDITVHNINIASNAWVDLNGYKLTVSGTLNSSPGNTGTFKGSTTSGLEVDGAGSSVAYFDPSANILKTLTVGVSGNLTLGNALDIDHGNIINGLGTVTANGTLDANGKLTLKSALLGTAMVAPSTTGKILNNVTLERFIPARRSWRFLAVPFSSSTQTIRDAWQEGVNNTDPTLNYLNNQNPNPGYGTHITGNNNTSLGYDYNSTINPSMKVWNSAAGTWSTIEPPTISTNIKAFDAYCLFVRGSRAVHLEWGTNSPVDNTILRVTGVLNETGSNSNKIVTGLSTASGGFAFVSNPYASPLLLASVFTNTSTTGIQLSGPSLNQPKFWVWDPKLSTSGNNVGAFVSYSAGLWSSLAGSYASNPLPIIENGEAFMVQLTGTAGAMEFTQSDKIASNLDVFGFAAKKTPSPPPAIYVNLVAPSAGGPQFVDGVAAGFGKRFSADLDNSDAAKLWNFDENIALIRNNQPLAIEFRPLPNKDDTLFFRLYLRQQPYSFKIFSQNLHGVAKKAWIVDKYLKTQTAINLYDTTLYSFTPNNDTNSYRNRFMLVFKPTKNRIVKEEQARAFASIYPNPVSGSSFTLVLNNLDNDDYKMNNNGDYKVNLYNASGNLVMTRSIHYEGSKNEFNIKLPARLASGSYIVRIVSDGGLVVSAIPLIVGK